MRRRVVIIACTAVFMSTGPLGAQAPDGWQVRIDRSQNAQDPDDVPDIKIVPAGQGFRVTGGPAGTFWHPANSATGSFTVAATFNLMEPSNHVNYYGLVFGGSDLAGSAQRYGYFVIAQNGTFQIRQRNGDTVTNVQGRTPHSAILQPDQGGRSTNRLEVRVGADSVSYVVNGTVVHTTPRTAVQTDGLVGVRVNHMLDVQIENFEVRRG